jgi:hypothetical protein
MRCEKIDGLELGCWRGRLNRSERKGTALSDRGMGSAWRFGAMLLGCHCTRASGCRWGRAWECAVECGKMDVFERCERDDRSACGFEEHDGGWGIVNL